MKDKEKKERKKNMPMGAAKSIALLGIMLHLHTHAQYKQPPSTEAKRRRKDNQAFDGLLKCNELTMHFWHLLALFVPSSSLNGFDDDDDEGDDC